MAKKKDLVFAALFGVAGAGAMYGSTKMKKRPVDKNERILVKEIEEELSEETEALGEEVTNNEEKEEV